MTYSVLSVVVSRQVLLDGDFASGSVHHEVTLSQLVSNEVVAYQVVGCLLNQSTGSIYQQRTDNNIFISK